MSSLDAQLWNDPKKSHLPYLASQKHLDPDGQSKCDTQHSKNAKNRGDDEEKQSMYKRKKKELLNLTPFHKC